MSEAIQLAVNDGIGLITFNRPEQYNTFSRDMLQGLGQAYAQCDADDTVQVVVVTGAGKVFCAGADLSDGAVFAGGDAGVNSCPLSFQAWDVRKPVIAACNGHAIGVGLGIAAQCDMRVLASEGKYGFLQARRGVIADFGIHHVLPRLVGLEAALEMITSGKRYSGAELGQMGFARQVVATDQVLATAMALAQDIVANCAPLVVGQAKRLVWRSLDLTLEEAVKLETAALQASTRHPDALEGGMAYAEKRRPDWNGRVSQHWPEWL